MQLTQKINEDLKGAMKAKDRESLDVLRMLLASIKNKKIELGRELADDDAISVIRGEIKKRNDSKAAYEAGSRPDLAQKEENEAKFLSGYLPAEIGDEELENAVKKIISELGDSPNFGQAMGKVMSELRGKADGSRIGAIVKKLIS